MPNRSEKTKYIFYWGSYDRMYNTFGNKCSTDATQGIVMWVLGGS